MASRDWTDELQRIVCPTLMLAPGHEPIGDHSIYEVMQRAMPDATLITFDGMPHNIGDAVPVRCATEVLRFIAAHGT